MDYLKEDFFNTDALSLAKKLLGKVLVHNISGNILRGKIVETEAYIGNIDKACHAYGGKRTARTETLYGPPGIAYVYSIYGMYHCFNVIANKEGLAEGVLIRAIEPIEGFDVMSLNRFKVPHSELTKTQQKNLANGPGKLCIAINIDKSQNWQELIYDNGLYIEDSNDISDADIIKTTRIGIDYAEEAKDFLWRFYIKGNSFISKT